MTKVDDTIVDLQVDDIRFPTRLNADGSDSVHDPDYSCAYVTITTRLQNKGFGLTFTIGRGNEIVCAAIIAYKHLLVGRRVEKIFNNFGEYWRELTQETQLRWLGPQKGVTHLAIAAIINALWDLWARIENKPLWKLLVDLPPEKLIKTLDFQYISDVLTENEALEILKQASINKEQKEIEILKNGYPSYTTSSGWLGYSDDKIRQLCKKSLDEGFTKFKIKVGVSKEDDERRVKLVREEIGPDCQLMIDANQRWDVDEAIEWVKPLTKYNLKWVEEPTSPDDILGHARIAKELKKYGTKVATGEHCQNKVVFKQLLQSGALGYCQIDSCRLAGPNEIIPVYLMAHKLGVPVCPHAGGVGLCEMVQHLSIFDFICISQSTEDRVLEYVDHLHEHFVYPVIVKNANYTVPLDAGYSIEMKKESLSNHKYPDGLVWKNIFAQYPQLYTKPI